MVNDSKTLPLLAHCQYSSAVVAEVSPKAISTTLQQQSVCQQTFNFKQCMCTYLTANDRAKLNLNIAAELYCIHKSDECKLYYISLYSSL